VTGRKVLVVDDDPDILEIVRVNLEAVRYQVVGASTGAEGLAKVRSDHPDLVVLDVLLPEIDGWEVLRRIEADAETAGVPVIMLTCKSEDADILRGLEEGAAEYVTKPFYPENLVASVNILLNVFDQTMRDERRRQLIARRQRLMSRGSGPGAAMGSGPVWH
jgi:DNA-binding response OmpR family regulator